MQNVHFLCHGCAAGPVGQTKSPRSTVEYSGGLYSVCAVCGRYSPEGSREMRMPIS